MNRKINSPDSGTISYAERRADQACWVWDARQCAKPSHDLFEPQAWRDRGRLLKQASGRGTAYFVVSDTNEIWVLRHYRRGGVLAHLNRDRYLWTGAKRTRPAREFAVLAELYNRGLSVPRPVAARIVRGPGLMYTADLITQAIANTQTLADRLFYKKLSQHDWHRLGQLIFELHREGVWHADLNARNVLIDDNDRFYLIDFDRARFRPPGRWQKSNRARLRRSLDKIKAGQATFYFHEADWSALIDGYRSARSALSRL